MTCDVRHWLLASLAVLLTAGCIQTDAGGADVAAGAKPGEIAFRLAEPNATAILVPVTIDGKGHTISSSTPAPR